MQHYSNRKYTVTVDERFDGLVRLRDLDGHTYVLSEERFNRYYVGVDLANENNPEDTLEDISLFSQLYATQLAEFRSLKDQTEDELYITGTRELLKNKPF
jgi:hypothetical protein